MGLNNVILMGRMTATPELKSTENGTTLTTFTLAVDRDGKGKNGAREADFVNCVAWRGTAEFITRYFTKGRSAVVQGRLQSRKWQDKDGNNRTSWEVIVNSAYFADSKRDSEGGEVEMTETDADEGLPF